MIRATICIPEQRLQRMRGKAMTNTNDNPYAAPTLEPLQKAAKKHHEFQVTDKGILCRTILELPKICLVTGRTDNLVPRPFGLTWTPRFLKFILFGSPALMLIAPICLLLATKYQEQILNRYPLQLLMNMGWLPFGFQAVLQLAVIAAILLGPRGNLTAFIHISVQQRIRRYKVNAVAAGVLVSVIAFGIAWLIWSGDELAGDVAVLASFFAGILGLIAGGFVWVRQKNPATYFTARS